MTGAFDISPIKKAVAIDISSTDHNLSTVSPALGPARGLYVGGAGNVVLLLTNGGTTNVTFTGVPAGTILPVSVASVIRTSTTATAMLALY